MMVVPIFFVEVNFIMELGRHYNPMDRTIKSENGDIILEVIKDKMIDVFGLNPNYTIKFIFVELYVEYEKRKYLYKERFLVLHKRSKEKFTAKDVEPFECEEFEDCFKNTYYFLNQILAWEFEVRIALDLLVILEDIQGHNQNTGFDYANFVAEYMHEDFLNLKKEMIPLCFPHYSLLLHILLWDGDYDGK